MGRAERDGVRAVPPRAFRQRLQRGGIADAAVTRAPETVELNRQSPQAFVRRDIVDRYAASRRDREMALPRIESARKALYPILQQLREDTARFLRNMTEMNLLQAMPDSRGQELFCIKEGVSGTTSASVAAASAAKSSTTPQETELSKSFSQEQVTGSPAQTETTQPNGTAASVSTDDDIKLLKRETVTAFIGLAAFDLLLKVAGFQSLIKRVEHWPTSEPRTTDREICRRVRAIVDRAQMYYPKKAMCLQHSAVVTCLLRRRGVPAEMVLAAQEFPAKAHAWAEVDGEVVNDNDSVKNEYFTLRRL